MTVAVARAVTAADYQAAFEAERVRQYPVVDAFEARCGYRIPRSRLEEAARVLACPVKVNPPNWQHGRVLYAAARRWLAGSPSDSRVTVLDIGTAKGFSAMCLQWAIVDADRIGVVDSLDVIDPRARVARNTVAEIDGAKTLAEIHEATPFSLTGSLIQFHCSTGIDYLQAHPERIHIAFVDGKHSGPVVRREGVLLTERQQSGDLAIFDDVHIPDVSVAVASLHHDYRFEYLEVLPNRQYAIGVRK